MCTQIENRYDDKVEVDSAKKLISLSRLNLRSDPDDPELEDASFDHLRRIHADNISTGKALRDVNWELCSIFFVIDKEMLADAATCDFWIKRVEVNCTPPKIDGRGGHTLAYPPRWSYVANSKMQPQRIPDAGSCFVTVCEPEQTIVDYYTLSRYFRPLKQSWVTKTENNARDVLTDEGLPLMNLLALKVDLPFTQSS
ncbi:uncharacterized protein CTRU02_208945 [Colletotrichum truncatum]|uniref:Uncharacterized protein n=1 Tax=Colletotrichum truncatum TaxID=5467 RepID=A0ACC3YXP7_COLTU|nr:uncharacterized protein CTRU02_07864 [Colletotrichum truncatum]KAF6790958.1 hypothetical protein CTRU02_07864 [Colletotrichum truncatum]